MAADGLKESEGGGGAACLSSVVLNVPVENAADEGGDERATEFSGGDGLSHGEQEREVARDAFLLQHLHKRCQATGTDA